VEVRERALDLECRQMQRGAELGRRLAQRRLGRLEPGATLRAQGQQVRGLVGQVREPLELVATVEPSQRIGERRQRTPSRRRAPSG
jgi:hypothetical protein